jgi:SAM-dependent methyltransferase
MGSLKCPRNDKHTAPLFKQKLMFSFFLGTDLFILLAVGIAVFWTTHVARKSAAPFYPTPNDAIRKALAAAGLRSGETFYDLGAGTGRALVIAEREFGARATGFELSWLFYFVAKINLFLRGIMAKMEYKDFWNVNLRNADVIFVFLAIRTMHKMEEKLKRELKPGARIIVYAFPLPGMEPMRTIPVRGQWKIFVYEK